MTLADWAALREAAKQDAMDQRGGLGSLVEVDDRLFVSKTFGSYRAGEEGSKEIKYDIFVKALQSPGKKRTNVSGLMYIRLPI